MARRGWLFTMMLFPCLVLAGCGRSESTRDTAEPPPAPVTATAARPGDEERQSSPKPAQEMREERPRPTQGMHKEWKGNGPGGGGLAREIQPPSPGGDAPFVIQQPTLGSSVIKVPSTMKEGRESIAQLIVSPTQLASLLKQGAVTGSGGDIADAKPNVRLMPSMRASLSAPGFDFTPKDAQEQAVKAGEPTVWVWTLVPQSTGSLTLVFTLEGILTIEGRQTAIRPPALTVPVRVEVNPLLFFENHWLWLMTAIVIPVVGFFGKRAFDRPAAPVAKT